jgi:hypothetical protein
MPLSDNIKALRDRATFDLVAAHDYYFDSKKAWEIARKYVEDGNSISKENEVTKTETHSDVFIEKAKSYLAKEVIEATFLQFISIFESFITDFMKVWFVAYPGALEEKKIDVTMILNLPNKEAIIEAIAEQGANAIIYDKPANWFSKIEKFAKLNVPVPNEIERIVEAKATRDLLIHNRGVVNATYLEKAGKAPRYKNIGDRVSVSSQYHGEIWQLFKKVVDDMSTAALNKIVPVPQNTL